MLPTHPEHDALGDHLLRQQKHGTEDEYDTETESVGPHFRVSSANRTETRAGRLNANHRAVNKSRWLQQPEHHRML